VHHKRGSKRSQIAKPPMTLVSFLLAGCGKMPPASKNRHPGRSEAESRDPEAFEMPGFPLSRE
jgi:hypothetical protein